LGRKKEKIKGGFIAIEKSLLVTEQWKKLSFKAIYVYIRVREKYNGKNEDDLSLTYREVKGKMSTATFSKALKELINCEILILVRPGAIGRKCNIFSIRNRWFFKKPACKGFQP